MRPGVSVGSSSSPYGETEHKLGNFLMMNGITGLTISFALWLTDMAANPAGVGLAAGVPRTLLALMLLFATNFFAAITPQGSSANIIFTASGYMKPPEIYKYDAVVTLSNTLVYLILGSAWITLLGI